MTPYDPERDGFDNARLMYAMGRISSIAAQATAQLTYGAWNPRFCAADAADNALMIFAELQREIAHYEAQAMKARDKLVAA